MLWNVTIGDIHYQIFFDKTSIYRLNVRKLFFHDIAWYLKCREYNKKSYITVGDCLTSFSHVRKCLRWLVCALLSSTPPDICKSVIISITNRRVVQHVISQKKSPNDPVIVLRGRLPSWQGITHSEVGVLLWIRHFQTANGHRRSAKAWDKLLHYAIFRRWILWDARSCLWDVQNNSLSTRRSGSKWRLVAIRPDVEVI